MRISRVPRSVAVCLLLALITLITLLAPARAARAGGVGVSMLGDSVVTDSSATTAAVTTVPFRLYKVPVERGARSNRDIDFLWSDTYKSRFDMPLDMLTGPQLINDMDRLGQAACEIQSNPLGLPMTDIQIMHNLLAMRTGYRDSLYNPMPLAPVGFRVAQPNYPDGERNHLDTYLYAPAFTGYGQWQTYQGDGSDGISNIANYGMFPSGYTSSAEDSLTGRAGSPLPLNSIQVPGPLPSQVGGTAGAYWTRPGSTAGGILMHEALHCLNDDRSSTFLHMFASGSEVVTGVSSDPPRYDVDYHFSLSPTSENAPNAYPHWQSFMAYLAFNWRGADTTAAGWADDLLRRWGTKAGSERSLSGLALRLRDSECEECVLYPGFSGLDGLARVQRLIHDWRVAAYVNNSILPGGKYGYPPQFGFSPVNQLGAWQNVDGVAWDDGYSVPPVVTLGAADLNRSKWFSERPAGLGFVARPLKLSMYGAEYFVLRADPNLASNPSKLLLRVRAPKLLLERVTNTGGGHLCTPVPPTMKDGRLHVSVVTYSQAADSLFRHPQWATGVTTQSARLDSVSGDLEFEVTGYGGATKAVLVVVTLEDGPSGHYSQTGAASGLADSFEIQLGATVTDGAAILTSRAVAASAQAESQPAWSADGTRLAYTVQEPDGPRIYLRTHDGSSAPVPLRSASLGQRDPTWSPRDNTVAYAEGGTARRIWQVALSNGAVQQLTYLSGTAHEPVFAPNGGRLAYLRQWTTTVYDPPPHDSTLVGPPVTTYYWDVRILDLDSGIDALVARTSNPGAEGPGLARDLRWSPEGRYLTFSHYDESITKYRLKQVDVNTLAVTIHDGQAPKAWMREFAPGAGRMLVEEQSGLPFPVTCSFQAQIHCNCVPSTATAPAHWIALRDTITGTSTALAYRTSATFTTPRWSPDGTKVAYTTTQNGNPDVYVAAATEDRAPVFSSLLQSAYSITACSPLELPLTASDPDGDPITRQVLDLPAGALLQSNGTLYWAYPVIGSHWIIARALDPQGAVATRVINLNVTDGGGCGGGGGEEDPPPILPGGNSVRQADSNRLIGVGGASPLRAANSFLDGAVHGEWVVQTARLVVARSDSFGQVRTRLAALRPGVLRVDRARLVVVDHAPGTVAVATDEGVAVGSKRRASRVAAAGTDDLTNVIAGLGEGQLIASGTVLTVEWPAADIVDGLVMDCARASAPESGGEWGVRLEERVGADWVVAGRIHPRAGYDALAVPLESGVTARLVFESQTYVREIAGYSLAGAGAGGEPATVTSVPLSGTDAVEGVESLAATDSVALELPHGQRVTMLFTGPPPSADQRRTLFLDLVASFTPEAEAGQLDSRAVEALPVRFALQSNRPNPFGSVTTVRFEAPRMAAIRIEVFDAQGRRIRTLADRTFEPGTHAVAWDGSDASGRRAGPGVYQCRMTAEGFRDQRPMVLLGW